VKCFSVDDFVDFRNKFVIFGIGYLCYNIGSFECCYPSLLR